MLLERPTPDQNRNPDDTMFGHLRLDIYDFNNLQMH